eukprot:maker-scaffold74_size411160-snap-gene-3.23 protein:Tk04231 transcript:maker-scaffold74_size411160-snap-gene-3.23-mRNA-1 annotation:"jaz protein"
MAPSELRSSNVTESGYFLTTALPTRQYTVVLIEIMSESPPKSTNGKNKKPRREDLFCTLCHVQTNSFKLLSAHLSGKLHSRKHRDRTLLNRIKDVRGWDRGLTRNRSPGVSSESQGQSLADAEELDPFFCVICALRLNSGPQMESHLLGSKHLKRSSQPKATTWSQSTNPELPDFIISLETGRGYKCKTCNLALNSVPQVFGS